jgi:LuxR family maltose regulon positive regulatory protein
MGESTELVVPTGRRHIIERPRLTKLLDETSARVIMLVAPAGYGKTTLARQWLATRPHAWYQATAASADVAALGVGITDATQMVTRELGSQFREWLLTTRGDEEAGLAAGFLVDDLGRWPDDAWLAIDDYHCFTTEAEQVLEALVARVPSLGLLITSRRRPVWATPRKLLYGEIYEIGRAALAMDPDEANEVLARMGRPAARGLLALADGWPAIIGLASFADASTFLEKETVPNALLDYVADELYASVSPPAREGLCEMSLLPTPSRELVEALLEDGSNEVLSEGFRVGFLTADNPEAISLHPLLRLFLRGKLAELPKARRERLINRAAQLLITVGACEGAFDLISEFHLVELFDLLLQTSLYELLTEGRLATISRFISFGYANALDSPVLELAAAELAFRQGFHDQARALSAHAGELLASDSHLAPKAFARAGQSAYFSDDPQVAITHFERSRKLALDLQDERAAVWGHFIAAVELEDRGAAELLRQFEELSGTTPDDLARIENGRLHLAMRLGELSDAFVRSEAVARVVPEATDPVTRTSFWHVYSAALRTAARYAAAMRAANQALSEIDRFHLQFAKAHVLLTQASTYISLGRPEDGLPLLDEVSELARDRGDVYLQMNEQTARCRLLLVAGDPRSAARATESTWSHVPSSGQYAELLACRAVALSRAGGDPGEAIRMISEAERTSHENEASHLCMWSHAILATDRGLDSARDLTTRAVKRSLSSGILDPLVFAGQISPLIKQLDQAERPHLLDDLIARCLEPLTTEADTCSKTLQLQQLTRREREVLALLAESKTNREIASALYLSEATVKVHVRHILRKLGVRTRTEAAVWAVRMQQPREWGRIDQL